MPIGTRHRVTGRLLEARRGLILEIESGGVYALGNDQGARRHLGTRVTVEGVRSGFERLDVDWIGPAGGDAAVE